MVPPVNPVGAGADPADPMLALFRQMVANETRRTNTIQRPKTIPSRTFKCGEDFMNFISHYRECVKATYNYALPADLIALNAACLSWLGTKLEPGPTLVAYDSLPDTTKADWTLTVDSLS